MSADPSDPSIVSIVPANDAPRPHGSRGQGRKPGVPNKNTVTTRFLIDQIVMGQMANIDRALRDLLEGKPPVIDAVTKQVISRGVAPNPAAYMNALANLLDFNLPRLTRVEVKDDRAPVDVEIPKEATQEEAAQAYLRLVQGG
jgi:hypothetical protein